MLASIVTAANADEFVYFSEIAGECAMEPSSYDGQTFSVFVLLDEPAGVTGLSFRLDTDRFTADNVQSVTPRPGVTIEDGNLFDGITLSVDGHEFQHAPVLDIVLSGHENTGYVWTRDIAVERGGGDKSIPDQITVAQYYDCFTAPHWELPGETEVEIGAYTNVVFRTGLNTPSDPAQANVEVTDGEGWVIDTEPIPVNAQCGWCPWSFSTVVLTVYVPKSVADKTPNEITLDLTSFDSVVDSQTLTLRAVTSVSAEESSWGHVKSLYR
jgi:hypothetical protein